MSLPYPWPADVMIRVDRTIEAFHVGDEGVSHRFVDHHWWGGYSDRITDWDDNADPWEPHPDPEAAWARLTAWRLMGEPPFYPSDSD